MNNEIEPQSRPRAMLVTILSIVAVLIVTAMYFGSTVNGRVIEELRNDPQGVRAQRVMAISFPNGRTIPVNYLREGNTVFAGSDFGWWKSIDPAGSQVELLIQGETFSGRAEVSQDEGYTYEVFERLRPDAPTWASRMMRAKLVVIELD